MGLVYLAALIVGGGVTLLQLLMAGDSDADAGDTDLDADADASDLDADADADAHTHAHGDAHHGAIGFLPILLSLRFWTFALLAFGMAGTCLHYFDLAAAPVTGVLSAFLGFAAGGMASYTFAALGRAETSSGASNRDAVGQVGRVLVACGKERRGKVRIEVKGQTLDMLASTDEADLHEGEVVLVEEVRGNELRVSRAPAEFLSKE